MLKFEGDSMVSGAVINIVINELSHLCTMNRMRTYTIVNVIECLLRSLSKLFKQFYEPSVLSVMLFCAKDIQNLNGSLVSTIN